MKLLTIILLTVSLVSSETNEEAKKSLEKLLKDLDVFMMKENDKYLCASIGFIYNFVYQDCTKKRMETHDLFNRIWKTPNSFTTGNFTNVSVDSEGIVAFELEYGEKSLMKGTAKRDGRNTLRFVRMEEKNC